MNIPNHVAIILDGNGRWAKAKGLPRMLVMCRGQRRRTDCEDAYNMGIQYLTSTHSLQRTDEAGQ